MSIRGSAKQYVFIATSPGHLALNSERFISQTDTRQVLLRVGAMVVVCFPACHSLSYKYLPSECGDVSLQRLSGLMCMCVGGGAGLVRDP